MKPKALLTIEGGHAATNRLEVPARPHGDHRSVWHRRRRPRHRRRSGHRRGIDRAHRGRDHSRQSRSRRRDRRTDPGSGDGAGVVRHRADRDRLVRLRAWQRWAWWTLWVLPLWALAVSIFFLVQDRPEGTAIPPPLVSGFVFFAYGAFWLAVSNRGFATGSHPN